MSYLAFDAATVTGWAYRNHDGEWQTGTINPFAWEALDGLLRVAKRNGINRVAIEDCYLGVNPQTHKVLAIIQGVLRAACDRAGLEYDVVPAVTWQMDHKLTGKRKERKDGAKRIATKFLGVPEGLAQDIYDSACLCDFVERRAYAKRKGIG